MKQASFYRNACVVASSLAVALCMFPVMSVAQEASLEEVIVTARKQEESLQDAPVSVSAFTAAAIEKRSAQSLDDIARFAPGLSFSKAFGRDTERPVIRGLGNVLAGVQFGVEAGAAYFIDGIYYPGDVQGLDLQDLERVEVIKGPQSALYGRNTYSGAINFITRAPAEELEARIKVRAAEHDESNVTFYISGPINDTLSGGLSLRHYEKDGEWTNTVTDREVGDESTWSFNGVLDWNPTDNFHVRLRRIQQRLEDGTRPFFLQPAAANNCFPGFRSLAARPSQEGLEGGDNNFQYFCGAIKPRPIALNDRPDADGVRNAFPNSVSGNGVADATPFDGVDRRVHFNSLLAEYDFSTGWRVVFASSYREEENLTGSDSDHHSYNLITPFIGVFSNERAFFTIAGRSVTRDYSLELRLESPADNPLRGTAGLFYYDQSRKAYQMYFTIGDFLSADEILENEAVFASLEYDFTDRLTGSLEVRYAKETKSLKNIDTPSFFDDADDAAEVGNTTFDGTDSWNNFTPRVTLNYQLNDDILLYGIYSQGVKPGGFNGSDGEEVGLPTYDQEESDNYELGIKSQWWDNRLQTNLALFFIDADDIQLTTPVDAEDAFNSIVTNQGSGEVFGVELDVQLLLTPDLTLGFNYALADSEFTEGCDEFQWTLTSGGGRYNFSNPSLSTDPSDDLSVEDHAAAVGVVDDATDDDRTLLSGTNTRVGDCSIDGNQFPLSSKHQASFFVDYERTISGDMSVFAGVDVSYEDKKYVQVHNLAYAPEATLVGARIGIRWGQAELAIVGTNLTDEDAPILATRWFQLGTGNSGYDVSTPDPDDAFGTPNQDAEFVDVGSPRAFFAPLREGRQIGVEFKYNF